MNQILHFQAEQIDQVFADRGLPSRVTGGTVTPRLVRFQVTMPVDVTASQLAGLSEEIALSLGTSSCRICREKDPCLNLQGGTPQVQVEVPRPDGPSVPLLTLCHRLVTEGPRGRATVPPITAVLGLDHRPGSGPSCASQVPFGDGRAQGTPQGGVPLLLRFPSPNVNHVLIAGTTGAGKTSLARTVITSLALFNSQRSLQLVLIDTTDRGFAPFEGLPHLLVPVITRADEALPVLQRLVAEMGRRNAARHNEPRLVVVADDVADLVQVAGRDMEAVLIRLVQEGHRAGIHLVACTGKPNAAVTSNVAKGRFPVRLVGSVASLQDAEVATDMAGTGAEGLLGQGDFFIVAKGQTTRMQAAYIEIGEVRDLVRQLAEGGMPLWTAAAETSGERGRAATTLQTTQSRHPAQPGAVFEKNPNLQLVK